MLLAQHRIKYGDQNNHNNIDKEPRYCMCIPYSHHFSFCWLSFFCTLSTLCLLLYLRLLLNLLSLFIRLEFLALRLCPLSFSLCLNRSVPCFCRRGALRQARSIFCDAPSAFQWKHSFQSSTASCPLRAVSSLRISLALATQHYGMGEKTCSGSLPCL